MFTDNEVHALTAPARLADGAQHKQVSSSQRAFPCQWDLQVLCVYRGCFLITQHQAFTSYIILPLRGWKHFTASCGALVIRPLYDHTLLVHSGRCDSMIILQLKIKKNLHRTYLTTGSCKLYRGEMRCLCGDVFFFFFKAIHPHRRWGQWQQLWSCCVNVLNMTQFDSDGASANLSNAFFTNT